MALNERVQFRLIVMPCCGQMLCWVNPRFPSHCPECGEPTERLCEGHCGECHEQNQRALDLHTAQTRWWNSLTGSERADQIRRAMR